MKSVGIFLTTFLIGTVIYFLFLKTETKIQTQQIVFEQPILLKAAVNKIEPKVQPKVFNVENFWNDDEKFNREFLEVGEVSNVKDIKAKSGESWFGLFCENNKEFLRPTKIKVRSKKVNGLDWKEISVNEKSEPLFLINKKRLKSGEVKTLFRGLTFREANEKDGEVTEMRENFSRKFYLNNVEYTLRTEKGISTENQKILVLLLETPNKSQIIYYIDYMGEGDYVGDLLWVGDLDRDGKLDLYMSYWNYEKGYYSSGIFLSSEAEKGKLVKNSDYYMLSGC